MGGRRGVRRTRGEVSRSLKGSRESRSRETRLPDPLPQTRAGDDESRRGRADGSVLAYGRAGSGTRLPRRWSLHWELLVAACAAMISPGPRRRTAPHDGLLAREDPSGTCWHRCKRCGRWITLARPEHPTRHPSTGARGKSSCRCEARSCVSDRHRPRTRLPPHPDPPPA